MVLTESTRRPWGGGGLGPGRRWAAGTFYSHISGPTFLQLRFQENGRPTYWLPLQQQWKVTWSPSRDAKRKSITLQATLTTRWAPFGAEGRKAILSPPAFPFHKGSKTCDRAQGLCPSCKSGKTRASESRLFKKLSLSNKWRCSPQKPLKCFLSSPEQFRAFLSIL